jgi:hypothetical protein
MNILGLDLQILKKEDSLVRHQFVIADGKKIPDRF